MLTALVGCESPPEVLADPGVVGQFATGLVAPRGQPTRIAVAPDGALYFTDAAAGKVLVSRAGQQVELLTGFDRPLGIAVTDTRLYVGSHGRGSVEVFDLARRRPLGVLGRGAGEFQLPSAIAVAPDGVVYVADSRANVVKAFGRDRALRATFGAGELRFPSSVAVDARRVAVADQQNRRVVLFDRQGAVLRRIGRDVPGAAASIAEFRGTFVHPQSVALRGDDVLALDSYLGTVQTFAADGAWKGTLGVAGCAGCARVALDLAVSRDGSLLVADPQNYRWFVAREVTP